MTDQSKSMIVFSADWKGQNSFRMMPISKDCPFVECIYDSQEKILAVIGVNNIPKLQMLPKLSSKGETTQFRTKNEKGEAVAAMSQERASVESYQEYYLKDKTDIEAFIKMVAINPNHHMVAIIKPPVVGSPMEVKKKKNTKKPSK